MRKQVTIITFLLCMIPWILPQTILASTREVTESQRLTFPFVVLHWAFILLAIAEVVFSLYMAFLCVKERRKCWFLWLPLILLAYGGISIGTVKGIVLGVFAYILAMPKMTLYPGLGVELYLSLPLGALIYWRKRKKEVDLQRLLDGIMAP